MNDTMSQSQYQVSTQDVSIQFQSNYNTPDVGPTIVMQLEKFQRLTGIDASGPAMVGICRLLEEEISPKQVAKVWRDELIFEDGQFRVTVWRHVPLLAAIALGFFVICSIVFGLSMILVGKITLLAGICMLAYLLSVGFFLLISVEFHRPYMICKRIERVLDRVNADLPSRIDAWRKGLRV